MKYNTNPRLIELTLAPTLEDKLWERVLPNENDKANKKRILIAPSSIASLEEKGENGYSKLILKEGFNGQNLCYEVLENYDEINVLIQDACMTEAEKALKELKNSEVVLPNSRILNPQ